MQQLPDLPESGVCLSRVFACVFNYASGLPQSACCGLAPMLARAWCIFGTIPEITPYDPACNSTARKELSDGCMFFMHFLFTGVYAASYYRVKLEHLDKSYGNIP